MKFNYHHVPARKDILHFIAEKLNRNVYEELGKNPERWIEELEIITALLTHEGLSAGIGINQPPTGDPKFQQLGPDIFLYRGLPLAVNGLWTRRETKIFDYEKRQEVPYTEWTNYHLGGCATLAINEEFGDIPPEILLPENFEPISNPAHSKGKRPIRVFEISRNIGKTIVYAKGADTSLSLLYTPPSYRLTNLSRVIRTKSKKELEMTVELADMGVKTPPVIGYYEEDVEEFLFLQGVNGKPPSEFLPEYRGEIISQDAEMLAALCLLGYRKQGFHDFDDKIFDGTNLHLIDVDEVVDLYPHIKGEEFRRMLVNPTDRSLMAKFQEHIIQIFTSSLRDALFEYQETLTPSFEDKERYIQTFCKKVGWDEPTRAQIEEMITFPANYETTDRFVSLMNDCD